MAARAKGGTSALEVIDSASTRPLARSSGTRSTRVIGAIARSMIARASSSEMVPLNGRILVVTYIDSEPPTANHEPSFRQLLHDVTELGNDQLLHGQAHRRW